VLKCNEIGYRLIHIWEDEWTNRREDIERRLREIFESREVIDFSKPLDRSWFNCIEADGYVLKEVTEPKLVMRNCHSVPDCGSLIYERAK